MIDTETGNKKWEFIPDSKIRGDCFDDMFGSYIFDKEYVGVVADDGLYILGAHPFKLTSLRSDISKSLRLYKLHR